MNDEKKTKKQLIQELKRLRREISEFKTGAMTREELIVNTVPMAFYTAETTDTFQGLWVSPQVEDITGFSPRQFTESPDFWVSRVHPDDLDSVLKDFETKLMQGPVTTQYRWLGKNGYLWMLDRAVLVRNARGRPLKVAGTWVDISERKEAEERLRSQLEVEQLLTEVSTHFINVNSEAVEAQIGSALRRVGEFINVEQACLFLFSRKEEFIKEVCEWVGPEIQPLNENFVKQHMPTLRWLLEQLTRNEPVEFSTLHPLPEGATREREFFTTLGVKSFLIVPIYVDRQLFAALGVATKTYEKVWFQHEVRVLKLVGEVLANTLARKKTEEELQAKNDQLNAIFQSSPLAIIVLDREARVTLWSQGAEKMFGWSESDVMHQIAPSIPFEKRESFATLYNQALQGKAFAGLETSRQKKDGTLISVSISAAPLSDSKDNVTGVMAIVEDISRRKRAEEELRESEQRYRALAESAQDFIFVVDKMGYVQYVNPFAASEFGLRPEELVGKQMNELFPPDRTEQQLKSIRSVYESGRFLNVEHMNVFPKGTLWYNTSLVPLRDVTGEINAVLGISRDITRRKQLEEALRRSAEVAKMLAKENYTIAEIGRIVSSTLNIEEIYERFAEVMHNLLPFDRISVSLNNSLDNTIRVAYLTGMDIADIRAGSILPFSKSVSEQLLERRSGMIIRLESEEEIFERFPNILANYRAGIRSRISVPLFSRGGVIGGLHVESLESNVYTEEHVRLLERVGVQISGAIANAQLFAERAKVEERLRESEEKYRLLVENAPLGICLTQGTRVIFANAKITDRSGYSKEDLTSMSFLDFVHPDDRGMIAEYLQKRSKGEPTPHTYRVRVVHKDGAVRWRRVDVTLLPFEDQPSQLTFLTDITEEVKKEEELSSYRSHLEELIKERTASLETSKEALSRSEKRYREIIETAQEGVWITDAYRKTSYINPRMAAMIGYPVGEVLDRPVSEFTVPEAGALWDQLFRRCAAGFKERYDFRFRTKEGKDIWAMVAFAPRYDEDGRFNGALLMVTDISERKEAVEKILTSKKMLQRVFDGISEPLIMVDKDFVVRMVNETARDYYQVETFQQIIGKPFHQDFLESDEAGRNVRVTVSEGRFLTFERRNPSDPNRFERVITYPLRENEGILGDAIIRISDITEARLLQREIIQNEKLASLGLLISSIAHEINNPNNFISFNIPVLRDYLQEILPILDDFANQHPDQELLGMDYPAFREDISRLLDNIEHGSTRINTVVSNLRDFSRKRDQQAWRWIHLREVIEKGVAICTGELQKKVKSVEINVADDLPMVLTDPEAVEQILVNLLINAIQAMDKEDSWIKIRAMLAPSGTDDILIEVSDNGCGMDENTLDRIFEPFFTTKPPGTGTGLGLYVSQNVIDELEGEITVESQLRIGSTFRIRIPTKNKDGGSSVDSTS